MAPLSVSTSLKCQPLVYERVLLLYCPTGAYCREDRCQSFFDFELIPSLRAPLEECEIGGVLRDFGAEYAVLDAPAEKLSGPDVILRIHQHTPQLIVIATTFGSLDADLAFAAEIKNRFPEITIGFRGAPCYVWAEKIITENIVVDFCVRAEYELAFSSLLVNDYQAAPGTTYRARDGKIQSNAPEIAQDLDALPLPDRSGIRPELYAVRGFRSPQATIRVQRGCPFPCSYCLVHTVSGNRPRHRSPQSIVEEIRSLLKNGVNHFYLRADTFSVNKVWAMELCLELQRSCPGIHWVTTTRVECLDEDLAEAMSVAGCYGISFGVDVASEEIGRHVRKPPQLERAKEAMRLCDKFNIISLAYFMIGFIWESKHTLGETRRFIKSIQPDLVTIHFAHPYPGTVYYEAVKQLGLSVASSHAQAEPAHAVSQLSLHDLKRAARSMLAQHYLRPRVIWSLIRKTFSFIKVPYGQKA